MDFLIDGLCVRWREGLGFALVQNTALLGSEAASDVLVYVT